MTTFNVATKAWLTQYDSTSPKDLLSGNRLDSLTYSNQKMESAGWTQVGTAEITVQFIDENTMVGNKVNALREEAKTIRAEATAKVTRIEGHINDLLALGFTPTVAQVFEADADEVTL